MNEFNFLDYDLPVKIQYITGKNYQFIENYVYLHQTKFEILVNEFRSIEFLPEYNFQLQDFSFKKLLNSRVNGYHPILTSKDGNCLYHSISILISGDEKRSYDIKFAMIFVMIKFSKFFKLVLNKYGYDLSFETIIEKSSNLSEWGDELNILGLSLLFCRPIYSYTESSDLFSNPCLSESAPLTIALFQNHFTALVKYDKHACLFKPKNNQLKGLHNIRINVF